MNDPEEIDTTNHFSVGSMGGNVVILIPPAGPLDQRAAYNLAAYLVALSGDREGFLKVLDAVEAT